jgi:hypothetical protein
MSANSCSTTRTFCAAATFSTGGDFDRWHLEGDPGDRGDVFCCCLGDDSGGWGLRFARKSDISCGAEVMTRWKGLLAVEIHGI